jgi:hypothetical protein
MTPRFSQARAVTFRIDKAVWSRRPTNIANAASVRFAAAVANRCAPCARKIVSEVGFSPTHSAGV